MSTTEVAKQEKFTEWIQRTEVAERIQDALGSWMDSKEFVASFSISCQDPAIAKCTEASKFSAAHTCSALGLLPSLGHIALIPREIRKGPNKGKFEVSVMPQWQGYKSLMERHAAVHFIDHQLVFESDEFHARGDGTIDHEFDPFSEDREVDKKFSNLRGGYLRIVYRDGRPPKYHFVKVSTMKKARGCAQTKNVWDSWTEEMCIKTLYRNAFARRVVSIDVNMTRDLRTLTDAEDEALQNDPNRRNFGDVKKLIATTSGSRKDRKRQESEPAAAATEAAETVDAVSHQTPTLQESVEFVEKLQEFREFVSDATDPGEVDSILNAAIAKNPDMEGELCEIAVPIRDSIETKQSAEGGQLFDTDDDIGQ